MFEYHPYLLLDCANDMLKSKENTWSGGRQTDGWSGGRQTDTLFNKTQARSLAQPSPISYLSWDRSHWSLEGLESACLDLNSPSNSSHKTSFLSFRFLLFEIGTWVVFRYHFNKVKHKELSTRKIYYLHYCYPHAQDYLRMAIGTVWFSFIQHLRQTLRVRPVHYEGQKVMVWMCDLFNHVI